MPYPYPTYDAPYDADLEAETELDLYLLDQYGFLDEFDNVDGDDDDTCGA